MVKRFDANVHCQWYLNYNVRESNLEDLEQKKNMKVFSVQTTKWL